MDLGKPVDQLPKQQQQKMENVSVNMKDLEKVPWQIP